MVSHLEQLKTLMPPPTNPAENVVDWERFESISSIRIPSHFKEFVGVYGSSTWFDHATPLYTTASSKEQIQDYLRWVSDEALPPLEGQMWDADRNPLTFSMYPEAGGLFPMMHDCSGSLFCWDTRLEDSEAWPIVCWLMGSTIVMEQTTISQVFLEWMQRSPRMIDVWGDINNLSPDRISLD